MAGGRRGISGIFVLILFTICSLGLTRVDAQARQTAHAAAKDAPTGIEMANVLFRYSPALTVLIVRLRGTLTPTAGHSVPSFNDPASFMVATDAAEIRMSTAQLSALMNDWLLRSPKAQLKRVRIEAQGNSLMIHGTLRKGVHIPFTAAADVGVTNDNRIRFTVRRVKAAEVPVKGLMNALGLNMDDMVSQKGLQGMSVDKDSFLIDPQTAFPAPQMRAKVKSVRITGQSLVIELGAGSRLLPARPWKNYIALRGGSLEYGREEMFDSNLTMIDSTPGDSFEFYLRDYWRQMVSGRIKAQPDKSLRVLVPDYSKLSRSTK